MDRREFLVTSGALVALASVPQALAAELKITSDAIIQVPLDKLFYMSYEVAERDPFPHLLGDIITQHKAVKFGKNGTERFRIIRMSDHYEITTCKRVVDYTLCPEALFNG